VSTLLSRPRLQGALCARRAAIPEGGDARGPPMKRVSCAIRRRA